MAIWGSATFAKEIHVAKTGNDSNAGTSAAPYLTIQKAANVAVAGDIVIIHEGTYEEKIRPANSGISGSPIVFKGAAGEKVIVTAMQAIGGWTHDKDDVYKTSVNWTLGQENFIMHNETALDLARWPNNTDGDVYTMNSLRNTGGSGKDVAFNAYLDYSAGIPNIDWTNGGSVHFYGDKLGSGWTTWRAFIKSSTGTRVTFDLDKNPEWIRTFHAPGDKGEFFLQGARGVLDYQNEWYFDEKTKTLYVQLPNGAKPADGAIKMRKRTQAFDLTNRNYIHIESLAVLGGSIDIDGDYNKLYQVSSFYGNYTLGVVKSFAAGAQSVDVEGTGNIIEKCEIAYGAATGVYDSGNGTKILNSYLHHFNSIGNYDAVLNARGGSNSVYKYNIMTMAGRDIIQAFNKNAEYSYNDVSFSNLIADDCALIYTVGGPSNSTIHHNWFHDAESHGDKYKAAGIYLDNDASNWDVHHNVVWNTEWTNVQINWNGTNINIYNNTLVKGKATMGAWHKDGTQFSNVNVWNNITDKQGTNAGGQEDETTWEPQSDKQNNLVDKESFADYANNNYQLKAGAQAIDYGRVIDGYTDGFQGAKPDVGAYEFGNEAWVPGITWNMKNGPTGNGAYGVPGEGYIPDGFTPTIENSVEFVADYTSLVNTDSIVTSVTYTAEEELDLLVLLYDTDWNWVASKKITVQAGTATEKMKISLNEKLVAGTQYILKTELRTVGGDWQTVKTEQVVNTTIIEKTFGASPIAVPGTIEAEDYDKGGEGISYHDNDPTNKLGKYRTDGVDIEVCSEGGFNVGYTDAGEWLTYTVNVIGTGSYDFTARTASNATGGAFRLEVDGVKVGESLSAPSTGDWHVYTDVVLEKVQLEAGEHVIRFVCENNGFNLDKFIVTKTPAPVPPIHLKKGWNLIGCPLNGNIPVETALKGIWDKVEIVKDFDGFYSIENEDFLNSLNSLQFGRGYFVKVTEDCELIWE